MIAATILLLAAVPAPPIEGEAVRGLCWIADVQRVDEATVRISFERGGPLSVTQDDRLIPGGAAAIVVDAKVGERMIATGGVHDQCRLTIARAEGRDGVSATAQLHLPGMPPQETVAFYVAR